MRALRWPGLILLAYLLLGSQYAFLTPPFEASDELWHYPLVQHLAQGLPLPVQDPANIGPWRQEASQPPLYYAVLAAVTAPIDAGDLPQVRRLNPHVDNGIVTPDGNINLAVHDPQANPWRGALLAVRVARLASLAMGAATVALTYALARVAWPARPDIYLGATAFTAFLPMFLFISGAVNNDNLIIPLATLALWLMARLVMQPPAGWRAAALWSLLGLVIGLAALTKVSGVGLLPLAAGAAFMAAWQAQSPDTQPGPRLRRSLTRAVAPFAATLLVALAVAGWWYARNVRLYGDWNGWSAFIQVLGQRAHPAGLGQLWDERAGFLMSFWGLFGGVNVPMSGWVYKVLNTILIGSVLGFGWWLAQLERTARRAAKPAPGASLAHALDWLAGHFTLVLCFAWLAAVIVGVIQWATVTWSSQGRLVFSGLSAAMILLATGLCAWLPLRWGRWISGALAGFLFLLAALAPWLWIRPAYLPPAPYDPPGRPLALPAGQTVLADFDGQLALTAATLSADELTPGQSLDVYLTWQALARPARDWSVFVHLDDPVLDNPVAQRDMYLGQGLLLTSWLTPDQIIVNHYHLTLPPGVITPAELAVRVGLYDLTTGERLPLVDGGQAATLATILVRPGPGDLPNPLRVNFGNEAALVGFALEQRRLQRGETITLTLYIEALHPLATDYTLFAQVLAESAENTTRYAAHDLTLPTSTWPPGDPQEIVLTLPIAADTPPGIYRLAVGLYTQQAGRFDNLPLVSAEGRITNDNILTLTKVRIDE